MKTVRIYVRLLDEGTECFRPTDALVLGGGLFKLMPTPNYDPEDETWEFLPESTVRGEEKPVNEGAMLVAVAP